VFGRRALVVGVLAEIHALRQFHHRVREDTGEDTGSELEQ
jgi:hypothetical protein